MLQKVVGQYCLCVCYLVRGVEYKVKKGSLVARSIVLPYKPLSKRSIRHMEGESDGLSRLYYVIK